MNKGPLHAVFSMVVDRPVAMTMIFLAATVFGVVSYMRLPLELMPDISYPTITVRTEFDGAAPQEVETQVSRPLESRLATLDGLVTLESRSRAGQSDVVLGFDWGTDTSVASQSIREKLQTVFLPDGAKRPLILRYDPSLEPFLRIALSQEEHEVGGTSGGTAALYRLRELADNELKRELEGLPGVAAVQIRGGLERQIRVEVREDLLASRRVSLDDVRQVLASENVNLAGGSILEGDKEYLVRTLNELHTVEQIAALRVRRADGVSIPLSDVAVVNETFAERRVVSHLNGAEAVEIEVFKEADANIVEVASGVKTRLMTEGTPMLPETHPAYQPPGLAHTLPEGMVLELLDDKAAFIESAVSNLRDTAMVGGLFAVVVLFLFLRNYRVTAIIALAIPLSVVIGIAPLYLLDVSLNLMSLGGLALGVGMLVDNAVVVLESIQRYLDRGESSRDAAVHGTVDVASAVTASTLTTVAVFFPITFVEGVAGELFGDLAVAVVASLLASLAVALFLVPTMSVVRGWWGDMPPVLGSLHAVMRRPEGRNKWSRWSAFHSVGPVLFSAVTDHSRRVLGEWLHGVGQTSLAARVAGSSTDPFPARAPRSWRWLLGLYVVPKALIVLLFFAFWVLGVTVPLALTFAFFGLCKWLVRSSVGRLALWLAELFHVVYGRVERVYGVALPKAVRRPGLVMSLVVLVLAVSVGAGSQLGTELIPEVHQGRFVVSASLPVGTPLQTTVRAMARAERIAAAHPDVGTVYTVIGSDNRADASSDEGEHSAQLRVQLNDENRGEDLQSREDRVMSELREQLSELPRFQLQLSRPALFSFRTPVEVVVFGHDMGDLRAAGDQTVEAMRAVRGLRDVKSSLSDGYPEVQVRYDRALLLHHGLDANTVATRLRDKVQGATATTVQRGEHRVDVLVQLTERQRSTVSDLAHLNVNPQHLPIIPLDAVAEVIDAVGPSEIRRVDQQRAVVVTANVEGFDLGSTGHDIGLALAGIDYPTGVEVLVAGQSAEMEESLASLQMALALAVFLVFVIMAITFESLVQPFVILLAVPLAVVGVALTLWGMGLPLSVVVFIGAIVLAGVVVNNAIVFVDTINRLRAEGRDRLSAIHEAGVLRLRPILITTMTTVLGLLPLSLGFGEGAEVQRPLAITVIGGLMSSTVLTLVVVPVVYRLLTRSRRPSTGSDLVLDATIVGSSEVG